MVQFSSNSSTNFFVGITNKLQSYIIVELPLRHAVNVAFADIAIFSPQFIEQLLRTEEHEMYMLLLHLKSTQLFSQKVKKTHLIAISGEVVLTSDMFCV